MAELEVQVTARDENSVTYTVTGGEPGDTIALPPVPIPPSTRVVDQFTGRVVDTPEQQNEYLLERNGELETRNQELEAENEELKATARLVISTIENMLQT